MLINQLSGHREPNELIKLIQYVRMLLNLEKDLHALTMRENTAEEYRERALHLLDWIPALAGKANKKILVNLFLQIGIHFQQASQLESAGAVSMADEKLALKMYLTALYLGHENATPDVEMYGNIQVLRYISVLRYEDPMLTEIIPALQKRALVIADVFSFLKVINRM